MGLDIVQLVMQVEETFSLDLPNDECEQVRTVGDLYRLVLKKLALAYVPAAEIEKRPPEVNSKSPPLDDSEGLAYGEIHRPRSTASSRG
jgi:hypothetical protein